jgi:hypothetical protein
VLTGKFESSIWQEMNQRCYRLQYHFHKYGLNGMKLTKMVNMSQQLAKIPVNMGLGIKYYLIIKMILFKFISEIF